LFCVLYELEMLMNTLHSGNILIPLSCALVVFLLKDIFNGAFVCTCRLDEQCPTKNS